MPNIFRNGDVRNNIMKNVLGFSSFSL